MKILSGNVCNNQIQNNMKTINFTLGLLLLSTLSFAQTGSYLSVKGLASDKSISKVGSIYINDDNTKLALSSIAYEKTGLKIN